MYKNWLLIYETKFYWDIFFKAYVKNIHTEEVTIARDDEYVWSLFL